MTRIDAVMDRYRNDPAFHAFVDAIRYSLAQLTLTPSEVREAAMLACIMFGEMRSHPMRVYPETTYVGDAESAKDREKVGR